MISWTAVNDFTIQTDDFMAAVNDFMVVITDDFMDSSKEIIEKLLDTLSGARELSPLELNEIRFAGRKTVITPRQLKKKGAAKTVTTPAKKVTENR